MTDRRTLASNYRVAARALEGLVTADKFIDGWGLRVAVPVVDLLDAPAGRRDRQLLQGQDVTVFEDREGWSFVQSARDGYVGYVPSAALADTRAPTHFVATLATHVYHAESMKSDDLMSLPFGARVTVLDERPKFFETTLGFVPKKHLRSLDRPLTDPTTVAQLHFGVPYLWGGNSTRGIDCSGLVQAALTACDMPCPGDSDMQETAVGTVLADGADLQRGDLIFWDGHVAMMVDDATLIHANAHHMAVAYEPFVNAEMRISAQGGGPITAKRRP